MTRAEVEQKVQAVAARRAQAEAELRESQARLAELEDEESVLQGTAALARRALNDLDEYAERLRGELQAAAIEEARRSVVDHVERRKAAEAKAADAARKLRTAHEELQTARRQLEDARSALRRLDPTSVVRIEAEGTAYQEEWAGLAPLVEEELNVRLDAQAVAAAAASWNPHDIDSLPKHLQAIARSQRTELAQRRDKSRSDARA